MKRCRVCKTVLPGDWSDVCAECFASLPEVRIFSRCGPCLTGYRLVRMNRETATVAYKNGSALVCERERKGAVHREPCPSCMDHERTVYPEGHMD